MNQFSNPPIGDSLRFVHCAVRIYQHGFTLVEILISLAVIGILAAIGATTFSNFNARAALSTEAVTVTSLLSQARAQTLAAKDGASYGVHFEERRFVLFRGSVYSAADPSNSAHAVHTEVKIVDIALAGGGSDVIFQKRTGATAQSGTIALALVRASSATKTVTIAGTGVAYGN